MDPGENSDSDSDMGVDETSDTPMEVNNTQASSVERTGRGAIQCKKITKMREGELLNVQYNEDGQRIGEGGKDLASYSGLLEESRISIVDYENWHAVGDEVRDLLWDSQIQIDDERKKKGVVSDIGEKWKEFKSRLTRLATTPSSSKKSLLVFGTLDEIHVLSRVPVSLVALGKAVSSIAPKRRRKKYIERKRHSLLQLCLYCDRTGPKCFSLRLHQLQGGISAPMASTSSVTLHSLFKSHFAESGLSRDSIRRTSLLKLPFSFPRGFKVHPPTMSSHRIEPSAKAGLSTWRSEISKLNLQMAKAAKVYNHGDGEDGFADIGEQLIPLILARAISVHKCQGMTLDCLHTDLSKAFDYGMVYVALSRVRNLRGLYLSGFDSSKIKAHPKVLVFYNNQFGSKQ
ncbi:hypothetical protein IFM89_021143 [Coptis chinensis]|uniref:ATP-dependent DNA helicase n=1 Tax=Coptis chinensis TaxID=261450 RepID=A0A835I083_9MAGN|nr:hypothetical protein IFM89_021143 [Coptis chinensis]